MNYKSILKKVGEVANLLSKDLPLYGGLVRIATSFIPGDKADKIADAVLTGVTDGLVVFQGIVVDAEVFGQALNLPGAQKAAGAAPAIFQLFSDLPILKGKKPKDVASAKVKAAALGGALADFLNEFE